MGDLCAIRKKLPFGYHLLNLIIMRPFKFFFAFSLGIVLFLFFARFFFIALVVALVLSGIFRLFAGFRYMMHQRYWEEGADRFDYSGPVRPLPRSSYNEPLFDSMDNEKELLSVYRSIEVR